MRSDKSRLSAGSERGGAVRQRVIDAAERLLRNGRADFSMRDLAAEAGVSFATPFNQFGSKAAIMHALSERRIDTMAQRYAEASPPPDAAGRVLLAIDMAVAVMLEEPGVNRAVMGWIGTSGAAPAKALQHSTALWTLALSAGEGLPEGARERALSCLPGQLAIAFRGALSFWTAGELPDEALGANARDIAITLLRGFTELQLSSDPPS
ncbi:TetR/AcrR family transcriptional regulator [Sphingomonas nostoxanthinifaciens]|uniref:TetR/AcrR family transcriptional regulator n=1 Tax=Sphingomonas nostoxanthinifaciens TaxID=2872652 RepID=UPI001CC20377|nr:TetR/AcrR family transcriptional regulator [Sphingomonas nostoxanthinifaciens]UAK26300.1 TetR/AcrR family transcriptional regulator [Sphingomonas nostoxanthinifaciens]